MFFYRKVIIIIQIVAHVSFASYQDNFHYSSIRGRYTREADKYNIVVPKKVNARGQFVSHYIPHFYKLHSLNTRRKRDAESGKINYVVPLDGIDHNIELWPNTAFMAPGLMIEHHSEDSRGNVSNIKFRNIRSTQCHYTGIVKGLPASNVALSTCYGLAGFISTPRGEYFIEPASDEEQDYGRGEEQLHIVLKRTAAGRNYSTTNCGTKGKWQDAWNERMQWEKVNGRTVENWIKGSYMAEQLSSIENSPNIQKKRGQRTCCSTPKTSTFPCPTAEPTCTPPSELYLEIMITIDHRVLHAEPREDIEIFILTIVNMVTTAFHDSSIGTPIHIKLVRLIVLNLVYPELDVLRHSPQKLLQNYCNWQMEFNPRREEHPNHHDFALLVTRFEPCQGRVMGVTNIASVCRPDKACAVVSQEGLLLANIIIHQIGHSLGAEHDDGENGGCVAREPDGTQYHMGPVIKLNSSEWSVCSKQCISQFISTHAGWCLSDIPTDHEYHFPIILPGQVYNAAEQCTLNFHIQTLPCRVDEYCKNLYCQISPKQCASTGEAPAPGTKCARDMWCFGGDCVERGLRPGAVNGEWGPWSDWTACTRSCGSGVQASHRSCTDPPPSRGGRYCQGDWLRHKMCAINPCQGYSQTFADIQCKLTDDRLYRGRHHSWSHYYSLFDEVGCALVCINEKGTVAIRSPVSLDGTPCNPTTRDVCIEGECRHVGCDWVIDSKSKEDLCGVCHGNGTECRVIHGSFTDPNITGTVSFLKLPVGTSMIFIREVNPSTCYLSITNTINTTFYLNRRNVEQLPGAMKIAGSEAAYETKSEMERVFIRQAIQEALSINLNCLDDQNKGVLYQYALPERQARIPSYRWEFLEWDLCSVPCGGGSQAARPACVEERSGEVEDKYCQESLRPPISIRTCNNVPCMGKWWVGPWSDCDCADGQGIMSRIVLCMRSKDIESTRAEVVDEKNCCEQPKPKLVKACNATKEMELIEAQFKLRDERHAQADTYDHGEEQDDDYDSEDIEGYHNALTKNIKSSGHLGNYEDYKEIEYNDARDKSYDGSANTLPNNSDQVQNKAYIDTYGLSPSVNNKQKNRLVTAGPVNKKVSPDKRKNKSVPPRPNLPALSRYESYSYSNKPRGKEGFDNKPTGSISKSERGYKMYQNRENAGRHFAENDTHGSVQRLKEPPVKQVPEDEKFLQRYFFDSKPATSIENNLPRADSNDKKDAEEEFMRKLISPDKPIDKKTHYIKEEKSSGQTNTYAKSSEIGNYEPKSMPGENTSGRFKSTNETMYSNKYNPAQNCVSTISPVKCSTDRENLIKYESSTLPSPTNPSTTQANFGRSSTTPWCAKSFLETLLPIANGTCLPPSSRIEDYQPQKELPSRLETANMSMYLLNIVPIETTKVTLPQTDEEFKVFGRLGHMPVGNTAGKITISGQDVLKVLEEAKKHGVIYPKVNNEDPS